VHIAERHPGCAEDGKSTVRCCARGVDEQLTPSSQRFLFLHPGLACILRTSDGRSSCTFLASSRALPACRMVHSACHGLAQTQQRSSIRGCCAPLLNIDPFQTGTWSAFTVSGCSAPTTTLRRGSVKSQSRRALKPLGGWC
jgi:hypothetical protein